MIPKTIHYCWFGDSPLPPLAVECMYSWKKHCGDFIVKRWDEDNFDINVSRYSKEAAKEGKWAFVADVARFYVLYKHGGIYLDVDVEVRKPIDRFLNADFFVGFENSNQINTGQGFGAVKRFHLVKKMLDIYYDMPFINDDKTLNDIPSPHYTSKIMKEQGIKLNNTEQNIQNIRIYPTEYFCPKNFHDGVVNITENTYTIHHFLGTWLSENQRAQIKLIKKLAPILKMLDQKVVQPTR